MTVPNSEELDVIIVGAGFSGLYQLHLLTKLGYKTKIYEMGSDVGGTWHWNRYPGARVDVSMPSYSFSDEALWKDWTWTEKFPGREELGSYFQHVAKKWDSKKDIVFNARVSSAVWDDAEHRWTVKTENGITARARFLVMASGSLSVPYTPPFKGVEKFKGIIHHTGRWPEGISYKGKRVAVVGTGSSGVQVIQEVGPEVGHLTVFQRTPNLALPMGQEKLDAEKQNAQKGLYPVIYRYLTQTGFGFDFDAYPKDYASATPEERIMRFEEQWAKGAFNAVYAFNDAIVNQESNDGLYAFWRSKVHARLRDPKMRDILAPATPPHPIVARRPSMEQTYYEVYNQDNVDLVDLKANPIAEFTEKGIVTGDGKLHEFDIIYLATGWDSVTGSMAAIDLRGIGGKTIAEKWKDGLYTHLGMTTSGFPNMFFTYGPQAPTAFSNAPVCIEIQGNWIAKCIQYLKEKNLTKIDASPEAEQGWRGMTLGIYDMLLMKKARGWWNGANIPGKPVEIYSFPGGIPLYLKSCTESAEKGYEGFVLSQ